MNSPVLLSLLLDFKLLANYGRSETTKQTMGQLQKARNMGLSGGLDGVGFVVLGIKTNYWREMLLHSCS